MVAQSPVLSPAATAREQPFRWGFCGLLFLATAANYMDRAVIGILKPTMMHELQWTESDYGMLVSWFTLAYAVGYALAGHAIDQIGVRWGYALAVGAWSLAAMSHGIVRSIAGFVVVRIALGLAEGGNFPAAVKAVGERFSVSQQAMAIALLNSGSNMGVLAALLVIPSLTERFGWQYAFVVTGASGFCWVFLWLRATRPSPSNALAASPASVDAHNNSIILTWLSLLQRRQVWAYVIGMALCSPVWWFYLFWSSSILEQRFGVDLAHLGWPMATIFIVADIGSIVGGWFAGALIRRGSSVARARKLTMLIAACGTLPVATAATTEQLWLAIAVMALAGAANQGFAANLFSIVTDTAPSHLVSSIVGLGGMFAGFAGAYSQQRIGAFLDQSPGDFGTILAVVPAAYFASLAAIQALAPDLAPFSRAQGGKQPQKNA